MGASGGLLGIWSGSEEEPERSALQLEAVGLGFQPLHKHHIMALSLLLKT